MRITDSKDDLYVSKNYRWDEKSRQFWNVDSKERRSDDLPDARLDVFADRVQTWFLDCATRLVGQYDFAGDYVALSVGLAYIEGVQQYREGKETKKGAGKRFCASARRIFPEASDKEINRCVPDCFTVVLRLIASILITPYPRHLHSPLTQPCASIQSYLCSV